MAEEVREAQSASETIKVVKKGKVSGKKKALTIVGDSLDGELKEEEYDQIVNNFKKKVNNFIYF